MLDLDPYTEINTDPKHCPRVVKRDARYRLAEGRKQAICSHDAGKRKA